MPKFVHQWVGPLKIVGSAGYDNYLAERKARDREGEQYLAHVSFLVSYYYPTELLSTVANDIAKQLEHEGSFERKENDPTSRETAGAAKAPVHAAAARRGTKRTKRAVAGQGDKHEQGDVLVELRRRSGELTQGSMFWSTGYDQRECMCKPEDERAMLMTEAGGTPSKNTRSCSHPPESWKTLRKEKACNRVISQPHPEQSGGEQWRVTKEQHGTLDGSWDGEEEQQRSDGQQASSPGRDKDGEPTKGEPVSESVTSEPGRLAQSLSAKLATKRASESERSELKSTTSGLCDENGEEAKNDELSDLTSTETSTKAVTDALLCVCVRVLRLDGRGGDRWRLTAVRARTTTLRNA
ncbi:hypothetical protein PInf_027474 [Phytophthora infestans]|nr:hypothetical protein PInf_027474 [Phytophthora infestans]